MKASTHFSRFRKSPFFFFTSILLAALVIALLHPREAESGQATVSWIPPTTYTDGTPLTNLAGYKLYYGTASGSYSQVLNVGNVTVDTVTNLTDGLTYYFAATAYDASGVESVLSAEVSKTVPPTVQQYSLTISKSGTGSGTVSSSPAGISCGTGCAASYNSGTIVTLTAAPATGSTFSGWSGGGCVGSGTCIITMNASAAVTASFAANPTTYTITATAGAGGSISPSGTVTVSQGGSQAFTIAPATGYKAVDVKVDGTSVGAVSTYTFSNVTANHTISATFAANPTTYTITATAGAGGSISPSGTVTVSQGGSQAFTLAPATGYKAVDVKVDGTSVGAVASYSFSNITANHTISATFAANQNTYSITATSGGGGSISPSGTVTLSKGLSKTFAIAPAAGYIVADVKVDGVSVGAVTSYKFANVTANHTIKAIFAITSSVSSTVTVGDQN
jgi:hypothetical protein